MQQSQMYPPQDAGPSNYNPYKDNGQPVGEPHVHVPADHGERFSEGKEYKDVPWAVLFGVHLLGILILCGTYASDGIDAVKEEADNADNGDGTGSEDISSEDASKVASILVASAIVAMAFSFGYLGIVQKYARQLIVSTMIASAVLCVVFGLYFFSVGATGMGFILLLIGGLNALFYYWWRPRIPFASEILTTVAVILKRFKATTYIALAFALIELMWVVFWAFTFVTTYFAQETDGESMNGFLYIFFVLSFYWTSQVIKNIVHVTISGTVATYYFRSGDMPENPTSGALKRATTTSFGSICLGSLIVAVLKTIRQLLRSIQSRDSALACVIDSILGCIEALVEKFNAYAFTQVAIYGKGFVQAAKDTWQLVKSRGIDAIINDSLIDGVLFLGALLGSAVTAGFAAVWAFAAIDDSNLRVVVILIAFLLGFMIVSVTMEAVESGTATIFVCFAEDPAALQATQPDLYNRFVTTYRGKLHLDG